MIKYLFVFILSLSVNCFAGVTVMGTRFAFNDDSKRVYIKLMNNDKHDFLIKTTIENNNGQFVITPALFVLTKNNTNTQLIIPVNHQKSNVDELYQLSVAMIPKSQIHSGKSTVSLAVRAHFNLIYRHAELRKADFSQLKLVKSDKGEFELKNLSNYVFTMDLADEKNSSNAFRKTLAPQESLSVDQFCKNSVCQVWVSFIDDDDSIVKAIYLSN
ncbi:fimbria/pilus periplasmic chaperone [Utexia brackfieldae]|uniref:fimbrial biogenesis chaperone n=1 Tax=Utexia brackfieldae TaxID=3074108 RepID=UPI00370D3403